MSNNLVCVVVLFKIVALIFPHRLRVCNAIYAEYRIVYRVVMSPAETDNFIHLIHGTVYRIIIEIKCSVIHNIGTRIYNTCIQII